MDHASARREKYGRNRLCNRVQELEVVQAEALLVEHASNFLARVLELLYICKHSHAQLLHLMHVLVRKDLAVAHWILFLLTFIVLVVFLARLQGVISAYFQAYLA